MQRVPPTEKRGRRHSSLVKVVWLDQETRPCFELDRSEVREEFIRTGGKGGQNRNKVSSCVRLTHLPTGIQVVADNQRNQAANRADAWERLETILAQRLRTASEVETNSDRRSQIDRQRSWTWTSWRDEVKGPGVRSSMSKALAGQLPVGVV